MKLSRNRFALLAAAAVLLSACRPAAPQVQPTNTIDPQAVFTAAAQTADAMMTQIAASTPTLAPATDTPQPSPTFQPSPTLAPTAALTATATMAAVSAGSDHADYVADITIPDDTVLPPGQAFVKTWQLKNTGTSTWTTGYALAFVSGDQMGGPVSQPLENAVAPGQTVNVSVAMTSPSAPGSYKGFWRMVNASGQLFDTSVYVQIRVSGTATTGTPASGTPVATVTPGGPTATATESANLLSNVILTVDSASYSGACPHTFGFNAQFTLNRTSSVTYKLEAGSDAQGFQVTLPDAVTQTFAPGTYNVPYQLEFNGNFSAWARLHITAPEDVTSNQVIFTLSCTP